MVEITYPVRLLFFDKEKKSILHLIGGAKGAVITNRSAAMHDVILTDFVIALPVYFPDHGLLLSH